ncbi:MAG: 1-acyl-sn-glycerol-3-phosphate acyltransferase [Oscillospiraceae bacterium]|nr:1-acyl-sn-glycerol-3-phosphate acyltransferase [Oscillospiraceae bacterium]
MIPVLCFAAVSLLGVLPLCLSVWQLSLPASILITAAAFILLHALYFVFFGLVASTVPNDRPLEKQNAICRFGAASILSLVNFYAGARVIISGTEKLPTDRRFLFVSNHRSMLDPIIVIDKLRKYNISFISKPSNMNIPLGGRIAYATGFLAIDRENDRNALKTILTAADYMKRDLCSIGIYPEGTRSKTNEMLPFHAGSFKIAQRAKAPIVVASVRGTEDLRRFRFFAGEKVYLDILEVIPAETVCALRTDSLSEQVRAIIQADLDRSEKQEG